MRDQYHIKQLERNIIQAVDEYVSTIPRPFGIVLSGGFDSGFLAALTRPDFVFTVRFGHGPRYDESRYADAIIDHLGLRAKTTIIEFGKELFEENLRPAVQLMGEPVTHFSLVPFYTLMKTVAQRMEGMGVTPHVLSGEGPDEYLGGYARQVIYDEMLKLYEKPELIGYEGMVDRALGVRNKYELVRKYAELVGYKDEEAIKYRDLFGYHEYPFQGAIGKMDMELGVIEKMEQKLANGLGVTLHYPYIQEKFAEYCYRLPDDLKIRDGVTKWAFREVCMKYLPEIMRDRTKMGGPVAPINKWITNEGGEFDKTAWLKLQQSILDENK